MDKDARIKLANSLCDQHQCNAEKRKAHFDQIVNHHWNPHPSERFVRWWNLHPEAHQTSTTAAYNSDSYRQQFQADQ